MDWRDWIVIERKADDKISDGIIKLRSMAERGFYNIKILKKEEKTMQTYLDFLAELQEQMKSLQTADIKAIVDKKVEEYRVQVENDELSKQKAAIERKQIEIDTINKFIDRERAKAEVSATCDVEEKQEEE